ncbi:MULTISPECIES: hypothetical protein [unclassified Clostridium]|uniref:hypothetical protein n=1 Tax=unclassified Clostridium TaxID=2614128 RepID=UPI00207A3A2D|nr:MULTISPECIES: hypothetical protein [unclassified Clostridium]
MDDNSIEYIVKKKVIRDCFELDNIKKGRDLLYKLYLKEYHMISDIEQKRLILYNLIVAEKLLKNNQAVKVYSEILKTDMDNVKNYNLLYTKQYCWMLSFFLDSHKEELSKNDLLNLYTFSYEYYKNIESDMDMLNAKFNIELINNNFNNVLEIIKNIHNKSNDKRYKSVLIQMLDDIKLINIVLYKKVLVLINNNNYIVS